MGTITGTIEDREEIRDLYARYAHTIDNGQFNEWIDCFTDDGVFESPRFGKHTGREGLRRFSAIYKDSLGGAKPFHQMTNVIFNIEGDKASGCCYLTYIIARERTTAALSACGRYNDRLRRRRRWAGASEPQGHHRRRQITTLCDVYRSWSATHICAQILLSTISCINPAMRGSGRQPSAMR